jgi:2-C-methyl-D-erythritol 2,4-cyclodiphosphate synthase
LEILSLDTVVILDTPKLAPYMDRMKESLAAALGVAADRVNVKAKTSEGVAPDFAGAQAVVLLAVR